MPKILPLLVVAVPLLASPLAARAADPAAKPAPAKEAAAPAPQAAPPAPVQEPQAGQAVPAKPQPSNPKTDAAEARYRAWVDREHAQDAAGFAKDKAKIEDKYKGYVRPKREKKDGKAEPAPAKGN